ncbi:unnamed protein product [Symbiodinium pilosum]|uniref:Uncharacterized protein n=1 Tax=Symbiodinium pilosum TaxID=2952 RepID=A0A812MRB2_SYMPI|nr:unnamed protein product [Symbiodinium pilosum]
MQTTTASFASSAQQTQHSNGSDTWRVDFASQAKKMGQEVLAALAAPAEQSPFDEVRKPEAGSRLAWTEIREDAQQAPQEVKTEAKPGKTEAKPEAKPEAKTEPQEEIKAEKAEEPQSLGSLGCRLMMAEAGRGLQGVASCKRTALCCLQPRKPKDSTPSAPSSPRNAGGAGGKKSLFTAVKALMQVARDDEGSKLAQMLGAVTDRRSASPSVESELQSRGSRGSGLTDANSSRKGTPEPGGRRKSSNAHKGHRSQTALVKAAAAFKSALSAVAGATDTTTGGNRRLSVAERMAMTSGSRPTDKDKESTEERSDGRIQDKARSPTKQAEKGGQEAEVAQKPDTPVHEFAAQRRERGHGRWKWQSQPFEAPLCSFQELVNVENNPTPLSEAMERVRSLAGGQNFTWERSSGAYGGRPTVPVTTLLIEPKQLFRPMFQFDPRSFHTFKLAWRHYLDFGSTDYRVIVGGELERWCQRCKTAIEKPFNAVYWLLLMIGSHYRESLASRRVVSKLEDPPEQVPIICIDSFVALSALLFSPERQVLYAGVDPTPSYLRWLQYIGDQYTFNKAPEMPDSHTVFEMNEFLDLPAVIIFYGRPQHRGRESDPLAWVNSPALIKSYIARYSEDNKCGCQVELAARLYTYSCSLGCCTTSPSNQNVDSEPDKTGNDAEKWYCWNGLKVCEIGVPVPHTQASFLSPFVSTRQVAFLCPAHGPDRLSKNTSPRAHRQVHRGDSKNSVAASHLDGEGDVVDEQTRSSSQKTMSLISNMDGGLESGAPSEVASDAGDDEDSDSRKSWSFNTQMGGFSGGPSPRSEKTSPGQRCTCGQYIHASQQQGLGKKDKQAKSSQGDSMVTAGAEAQEVRQALSALGEYDLLHTFVGLMSGGLNMAKSVLRLHFSIDPAAYQNLPEPACKQWDVGLMPWYREFHRMDMHSRSRHGMLLASLLRGMLGDGLTSGLHDESLDMLRLPLPIFSFDKAAGRAAGHVHHGADAFNSTSADGFLFMCSGCVLMSFHKSYPFGPLARSGKLFLPGSLFDGLEALMPRMRCRAFPAVCAAAAAILACQCVNELGFVAGQFFREPRRVSGRIQLQALKRLSKKEKIMTNVANMKKMGTRRLSSKLINKQLKKVNSIARDDDWVNEFLSFSRPQPVGGEYVMPPEVAKAALEEIYGSGPDLQNIDLDELEEDEDESYYAGQQPYGQAERQQDVDELERMRRKADPSKSPGQTKSTAKVRWTMVPGVQKYVGAVPRNIAAGKTSTLSSSSHQSHQDVWISGGSIQYDYEEKPWSHSFMRSQSQDSIMSNDDKPERQAEADARSGSKAVPKRFLNNVQVCCALVGCESPLGLKHHFEAFNQWCHSAHLLPFVKRCYRRCGIAGLAAGQHVGHHKKGANPFYPLVLPTVPTVCYGHCYPLHKVFQYFYAGTEKILCSIDDSKAVEADRATWGLAPGQDRLNNQCWFKVADDHDIPRDESPTAKPSPAKQMRMLLTAGGLPGPSDSSDALARPTSAMREPSKGKGSL